MKGKCKATGRERYSIKQLRKIISYPIVKQFYCGTLKYKDTGKPAQCQIKGCGNEEIRWLTITKKGIGIVLCFGHGEEV